ncbi:MAG: hypothetical protein KAQ98_10770 [Bacteriovoracaceae bacterium]|nr:hypothetical protein [Bacteriovoracaceae bacterium]
MKEILLRTICEKTENYENKSENIFNLFNELGISQKRLSTSFKVKSPSYFNPKILHSVTKPLRKPDKTPKN